MECAIQWELFMYEYVSDGSVGPPDRPVLGQAGNAAKPARKGSKYVILTVSVCGLDITWCSGPGISTIFVGKSKSPRHLCVLSPRPST